MNATFTQPLPRVVAIQLQDANRANIAERTAVHCYLSQGQTIVEGAACAISGGTRGLAVPVGREALLLISDNEGAIDLAIGDTVAGAFHLNLVMPDSRVVTSDAISFAE